MKRASSIVLGAMFLLGASLPTLAKPMASKQIPDGAKWLLHVDADAVVASQSWKIVYAELEKNPEIQAGIQNIEMITGFKFPADLHGLTVYGKQFNEESAVVVVNAAADQTKVAGVLAANPTYTSFKYGNRDVHAWEDKGKKVCGSFSAANLIVAGQSRENIQAALDLLDGKGQPIKLTSPLAAGAAPGILAYVAGDGLAQLNQAQSPLLNQVDSAWISIAEQEQDLLLRAAVIAKTPEMAEQMRATVEGIKAMVMLSAMGEKASPEAKAASAILQNLTAKTQGTTVTVELRAKIDAVKDLAVKAAQKRAAARQ